jgi:acyl-coenzyme A thioesterase PaaI-like protein
MNKNVILQEIKASQNSQDWHQKSCYGCGPDNAKGIHANFPFHEESGEVRYTIAIEKDFEGPPGYVHGGVLATLMDEAQGVLCFHIGHFVMTDHLYIRYSKACPLGEEIEIRCWVTMVRKRRIYTKATIHLKKTGDLLVSSKARWYDISERTMKRMFQDSELRLETLLQILELNKKRGKEIRKRIKQGKV